MQEADRGSKPIKLDEAKILKLAAGRRDATSRMIGNGGKPGEARAVA